MEKISNTVPSASACFLQRLQKSSPKSPLTGLAYEHNCLTFDESYFDCCSTSGICTDEANNLSIRCDLSARRAQVYELTIEICRRWSLSPDVVFDSINQHWHLIYADLQGIFNNNTGVAFRRTTKNSLKIWQYSLMAVWLFGAQGRIISLTEAVRRGSFGFNSEWLDKVGPRRFIAIEGVSKLWDPLHAQMFEELLILCESHRFIPIVEIKNDATKNDKNTAVNAAGGMTARVAKMRRQGHRKFISNRARGLLGRLCQWKEEDILPHLSEQGAQKPQSDIDTNRNDLKNIDIGF